MTFNEDEREEFYVFGVTCCKGTMQQTCAGRGFVPDDTPSYEWPLYQVMGNDKNAAISSDVFMLLRLSNQGLSLPAKVIETSIGT